MVFKEEAYKEVFPDVIPAPAVVKQESMISDQDDDRPAEETGRPAGGTRRYRMKNHKFFAWATVFCFLMTMYTGYKKA